MKSIKNMIKDESGVSPIVATLVLIVVAVVGAVAVGTIVGTFSTDVADQNNVGDVSGASATEIIIAGSTTVQPVSELLAEAYMKEHPGIKITVQGGGSGAGISSAGMGIVDIGSASRAMKDEETTKYPDLVQHKIGGSAVVFISNVNSDLNTTVGTVTELKAQYTGTATPITAVYERDESSGTEDTVKDYFDVDSFTGTTKVTGNAGILEAVKGTDTGDKAIGFVDWSYADGETGIYVADIDSDDNTIVWIDPDEIDADELQDVASAVANDKTQDESGVDYPVDLGRLLFYITDGTPSSIVQSYMTFCQSPAAFDYFEETGYWPIVELV